MYLEKTSQAIQLIKNIRLPGSNLRALLPLGGGLALLALLGSSPHTDIMAHLLGLISGYAAGTIYALHIAKPLSVKYQTFLLILTNGILLGAWLIVDTGSSGVRVNF